MDVTNAHRGPEGEIMITVAIPETHGDWTMRQVALDRKTVLALIADLARMMQEDEQWGNS